MKRDQQSPKMAESFEKKAIRFTKWIGSTESLFVHSCLFLFFIVLIILGAPVDKVMLVLTTIVSLEAIYLSIFIQMSVNNQAVQLAEVSEDIDEIQEDIDEIQEDIDEIQEDVDEIQEDVEDIQEDIDEIQEDVEDIQEEETTEKKSKNTKSGTKKETKDSSKEILELLQNMDKKILELQKEVKQNKNTSITQKVKSLLKK